VGLLADVGVSATRRGRKACLLKKRRSGMSSTKVAKKYHVSRATVCRLANESGGLKNLACRNFAKKKE
jgi:transposase